MRFLYIALTYLLVPVALILLLWRGLRERSYWRDLDQRFGFGAYESRPGIWVHAVSMGEVQASAPLVRSLRARYPQFPVGRTPPPGSLTASSVSPVASS